jgi:hypothetical protein
MLTIPFSKTFRLGQSGTNPDKLSVASFAGNRCDVQQKAQPMGWAFLIQKACAAME